MKKLRKVSQEELRKILELHKLWLEDNEGGERADLSYCDLRNTDLTNADLRCANLSNANLRFANLRFANLRFVGLTNANLSNADLTNVNLSNAILTNTNLSDVNLKYANLSDAYLRDVNLTNANLYKTNLFYAKVDNMIGINNVGNENRTVYYFYKENRVICGCFDDTLEEFKKAVKEKYGEDYGSYAIAIEVFERMKDTK